MSSVVPAGAPGTYTVRRGDSIARIAKRLGIDPNALLAANSIKNGNLIIVGQTLRVPGNENLEPRRGARGQRPPAPVAVTPAAAVLAPSPAGAAASVIDPEELEAALAPAVSADDEQEPADAASELADDADESTRSRARKWSSRPTRATTPSPPRIKSKCRRSRRSGHYADWLELPTQRLRDLNGIKYREAVEIGQMLTLDFARVDAPTFEQRRVAYQQQRQNEFFAAYQIADAERSRDQARRIAVAARGAQVQGSGVAAAAVQPGPEPRSRESGHGGQVPAAARDQRARRGGCRARGRSRRLQTVAESAN